MSSVSPFSIITMPLADLYPHHQLQADIYIETHVLTSFTYLLGQASQLKIPCESLIFPIFADIIKAPSYATSLRLRSVPPAAAKPALPLSLESFSMAEW
jgi:hypothetical protein